MAFRDPIVYDDQIVAVSLKKLISGQLTIDQYIESNGYDPGNAGWRINGNGDAEFNSVIVRGDLIHPNLRVTNDGVFIREETGSATQTIPKIRFIDEFEGDNASIHKRANGQLVIRSLTDTFLETDNVIGQGEFYKYGSKIADFQLVHATHNGAVKLLSSNQFSPTTLGENYPTGISLMLVNGAGWPANDHWIIDTKKMSNIRITQDATRWNGTDKYWRSYHKDIGWTAWKQYT